MLIATDIARFHKGRVLAVEPNIPDSSSFEHLELVTFDVAETLADIAVLLVDHNEFKSANAPDIEIIIDTKGIWSVAP